MSRKKTHKKGTNARSQSLIRASISFPVDLYDALQALARQKKVSLAWVVRDAAEKYIAERRG
jgi:metal-responsive CopG/Arc/MetJ family transcriptional regulator